MHKAPHKVGNPTTRRWRQKYQIFRLIFSYIVSSRLAWVTGHPVSTNIYMEMEVASSSPCLDGAF